MDNKIKNSNRRIVDQLEKEQKANKSFKKIDTYKSQGRISFWDNKKAMFFGMDSGEIHKVFRLENDKHLTKSVVYFQPNKILQIKKVKINCSNNEMLLLISECSIRMVSLTPNKLELIAEGNLSKRLLSSENILNVFIIHENKIMCVITNQSRAILFLVSPSHNSFYNFQFLDIIMIPIKQIKNCKMLQK